MFFFQVDRTPLHMAAQHGHTLVVELLISSGACANNIDMVTHQMLFQDFPLCYILVSFFLSILLDILCLFIIEGFLS